MQHNVPEINYNALLFYGAIGACIFWIVFYYVAKAAVKNGILESKRSLPSLPSIPSVPSVPSVPSIPSIPSRPASTNKETTKPVDLDSINDRDVLRFLYKSGQVSASDYEKKKKELSEKYKRE